MFKLLFLIFFSFFTFNFTLYTYSFARTTPEDILNTRKDAYQKKVSSYSSENKQRLDTFSKKIADLNKNQTDELNTIMERQAQIFEEYLRRERVAEKKITDGVNRNLSDDIENTRYWLTFAHEAVAYQAAKVYIFDLTSEGNIKNDILSDINRLENDLDILKGKAVKSQKILKTLVKSSEHY